MQYIYYITYTITTLKLNRMATMMMIFILMNDDGIHINDIIVNNPAVAAVED